MNIKIILLFLANLTLCNDKKIQQADTTASTSNFSIIGQRRGAIALTPQQQAQLAQQIKRFQQKPNS